MKTHSVLFGVMALCLAGAQTNAADITVRVTGVASDNGTIRAALHDGAEGFPLDRPMVAGVSVQASSGGVTLVFKDVAPGRYAITAFHDENGDEALSTNLLGIPYEPFGFSKDARGSFGPPGFEDAAFDLGDKDLSLTFRVAK